MQSSYFFFAATLVLFALLVTFGFVAAFALEAAGILLLLI
jgi:hypothetical protein